MPLSAVFQLKRYNKMPNKTKKASKLKVMLEMKR
jgi:hypothetical protein